MKLKNILAIAFAGSLGLSSVCIADTIVVGAEPAFAPFEYIDNETKELTGFDIELIKAIIESQGHEVEFNTMPFDALIPALLTHTVDVALSAITITDERKKRVDFSNPYYKSGLSILINAQDKDKIKSEADLVGQKICVQIGTTGSYYAQNIKDATVNAFNTAPESYIELKAKGCVAAINDKPVNDYYLVTTKDKSIIAVDQTLSAEDYGIAVAKGDSKMLEIVNKGLLELQQNGTYQKLYDKYFKAQ